MTTVRPTLFDRSHEDVIAPPRAGLYQAVMADSPWLERGGGQIKRGADRHYPLMKTEAIAALPVSFWAAPDAHLYLWVTNNFLPDGLVVMTQTWALELELTACVQHARDLGLSPAVIDGLLAVKMRVARELRDIPRPETLEAACRR